ncbi:MAG: NAD-dependent succinate-semialdehyde dehydrogenase [Verrucomicrobiota bacterium]
MLTASPHLSPNTGESLDPVAFDPPELVERKLQLAADAFRAWRTTSFKERGLHMKRAGELLRTHASDLALLAAEEMGKPLAQGKAEAEKCAWVCEYYAEHAESFLADQPAESTADMTFTSYQPLGLVLGIMPWNFPFWQVFRAAAPILSAGNTFLLKHAPNVPECALAMTRLMHEAGFPEGVFNDSMVSNDQAAAIIADRRLAGVTLTGSTRAGRAVSSHAGQHLKKSLLELGGSDPYVILADANLDHALNCCATSRMINNGQSCIAAKRFIVVESQYDAFVAGMKERLGKESFGDPISGDFTQGPIARHDLRDQLHDQVMRSIDAGVEAILGATVPDNPGAFYLPTILVGVGPDSPAFQEELFGPVAAVAKAKDEAEAIALANHTTYGLGAAVFTDDLDRGCSIAREQLHAGCCVVNDFVKSDPRVPFGGIGDSGYGRELGAHGIREFCNLKTVALSKAK